MGHIWKHVVLFCVVLLFLHHHLPVNSEHQRNSSHEGGAQTMVSTSSRIVTVNRRGGGGGHGSGGHGGGGHSGGGRGGGGHENSVGMHGDEQHKALPLYGAAGAIHPNHYGHPGTSNGILNYVSFYQYFPLFILIIAAGIPM